MARYGKKARSEAAKLGWKRSRRRNGRLASQRRKGLRAKGRKSSRVRDVCSGCGVHLGQKHRPGCDIAKANAKSIRERANWMKKAFATHKRGSLHRFLKIPQGKKIPVTKLRAAERRLKRLHAAARGTWRKKLLSRLREVRLALTARKISRKST